MIPLGALVRDLSLPALGYGRVIDRRGRGAVAVLFQVETTPREVRPDEQKEFVRARLHAGQKVEVTPPPGGGAPRDGTVVRALEPPPQPRRRPEDDVDETLLLHRYEVDTGGHLEVVREDALLPRQAASDDPLDRLEALSWDPPAAFFARAGMHKVVSRWFEESFGIPALLGARIEFLPHQVHAARRVLCDRAPRYVLADEVGLGKTIEAGLVAQALAAARPELRVLVVAPGSMSRQWLCELFLRFGEQVFVHLDLTRLSTGVTADLVAELPARPRVIVSTTALEAFPELQKALRGQRWDLLVVDEAHQVPPDRPLYGFLREVAEQAPGVLLLSATPGKRDEEGLRGLLALVAPEAYGKGRETLARRLAAQEAIAGPLAEAAALVDGVTRGAELSPDDLRQVAARWKGAVPHDPVVEDLRARLVEGDEEALGELVAYAQEFHRVDRRIVRTRRATVRALGTALCERRLELVKYKAGEAEAAFVAHVEALPDAPDLDAVQRGLRGLLLRLASTTPLAGLSLLEARRKALEVKRKKKAAPFDLLAALTSDPGSADEERLRDRAVAEARALPGEEAWLTRALALVREWMVEGGGACARFRAASRWVRQHLADGGSKVLVFSQEREVVDELAAALTDELGEGTVERFHHGLEDGALSEAALKFQQPGDCRVLVSDELGGEGRNFQVASAVVHLDQPWSPARVEQRVGRLDRIGRDPTRPVLSVVLSGPSKVERALVKLHGEVLKVYERSLGGLELLMPRVQQQVAEAACRGGPALEALGRPIAAAIDEERARQDEAWERALDASRRSLDDAAEHAEVLAETDGERDAQPLAAWARRVGISVKPLGDEVWSIGWSWEHLKRVPEGLAPPGAVPTEGRARRRGTFSRRKALQDEALELFAPGHPLIDALARDALGPTDGRAAAFARRLGEPARGRAFAVVLGRTDLDRGAWQGLDMPAGLVYRAQARLWPQTRPVVVELHLGRTPQATVLADRPLQTRLLEPPGDPNDPDVDPELRDVVTPLDRDALAGRVHLPHLLGALRAGVELALDSLRQGRRREADGAAQALLDDLRDDLGYLRGVAAREPSPMREEAIREAALRERLVESVRREQVLLDAVAVVLGA